VAENFQSSSIPSLLMLRMIFTNYFGEFYKIIRDLISQARSHLRLILKRLCIHVIASMAWLFDLFFGKEGLTPRFGRVEVYLRCRINNERSNKTWWVTWDIRINSFSDFIIREWLCCDHIYSQSLVSDQARAMVEISEKNSFLIVSRLRPHIIILWIAWFILSLVKIANAWLVRTFPSFHFIYYISTKKNSYRNHWKSASGIPSIRVGFH
jgi:hypothetical protein